MNELADIHYVTDILYEYGVLESWVLAKHPLQYKIVCPYHDEVVPSCDVKLATDSFYCFGCRKSGNLHQLVAHLEWLSNPEITRMQAVARSIRILAGTLSVSARAEYVGYNKQEAEYHAEKYYESSLETAWKFYSSLPYVNWHHPPHFATYLLDRGYPPDLLGERGVKYNQVSTNPVVIPLYEQDHFAGYVARRADDEKYRKYKNNPGFKREYTLVGNMGDGDVLVVEGMCDLLRAVQHGHWHTVCLMGNMPSAEHLKKLSKAGGMVVWATDADAAGERGYRVAQNFFKGSTTLLSRYLFPVGAKDIGDIADQATFKEHLLLSTR